MPLLHWAQWGLSWLVRAGLLRTPQTLAPLLLRAAGLFDRWGTGTSAFHLTLAGEDAHGQPQHIRFELIARSGEGAYIPCIPAVLLTRYIAQGLMTQRGATACIGLIDRNAYLDALEGLKISWQEHCDMPTGSV